MMRRGFEPAQCRSGCIYEVYCGTDKVCNYYIATGKRRPCKPGKCCTVYDPGNKKPVGVHMVPWNVALAKLLYALGISCERIAREVGTSAVNLRDYARRHEWKRGEERQ